MSLDLEKFNKESKSEFPANKKLKDKIKATRPKNLDARFQQAHDDVFSKVDCLDCANCCKTTSPILIQTDIDRLSKVFRMRSSEFIDTYLFRDEDGDYVFKGAPCPFLGEDNGCLVYEDRPKACREYPHTNQSKIHTIFKETLNNTGVCPAVFQIVERLKSMYK